MSFPYQFAPSDRTQNQGVIPQNSSPVKPTPKIDPDLAAKINNIIRDTFGNDSDFRKSFLITATSQGCLAFFAKKFVHWFFKADILEEIAKDVAQTKSQRPLEENSRGRKGLMESTSGTNFKTTDSIASNILLYPELRSVPPRFVTPLRQEYLDLKDQMIKSLTSKPESLASLSDAVLLQRYLGKNNTPKANELANRFYQLAEQERKGELDIISDADILHDADLP